jgi:hypothetical protein
MRLKASSFRAWSRVSRDVLAICCAVLLVPGAGVVLAQQAAKAPSASTAPAGAAEQPAAKIPPEQLESLVAPIALYPDDLLAQTLAASTYPLEIVQLQQWLAKHPDLKDKALADSVAKQPWDPSIQSMAALPELVKRLADDVQWTTDLGNAFLAQQADVMDAVQRMRKKAKDKGTLESNEQQKVETKVVEKDTVIIVVPANPEVIYVPTYSPTVVYGPPVYPYPPIYYPPPPPPGAYFMAFTVGVMWHAAYWGGPCCGCGWGGSNNIYINNSNNFNQINHNVNRGGAGGNNNWQHNSQHRGGTPYPNQNTANKYGGQARGASAGNRATGGASAGNRAGSTGASNRATGGAGAGGASASTMNRGGTGGAGSRGGSNQIGSRNIPQSSGSRSGSGFSGGSSGYSGSSARASSSRGASSMGAQGGGGRGGGGRR